MTRSLTTAVKNELATNDIRPVHLITIGFSTPINITDCSFSLTSSISGSSVTYSASDFILGISNHTEETDITKSSITINLSGADQTFISTVLNENVINENVIKENVINVNENIKQTMINVLQDKIHINMNNEKNKKKSKSSKQNMYYINEEIDNKILNEYSNLENNIISIAKDNNLEVYKIVSILIKHKIINTRNECRGYDIYKESDEYKLKINKS